MAKEDSGLDHHEDFMLRTEASATSADQSAAATEARLPSCAYIPRRARPLAAVAQPARRHGVAPSRERNALRFLSTGELDYL